MPEITDDEPATAAGATPVWNPVTGTFADPAQSTTLTAEEFAAKISQGLAEADVASHDQAAVIDILGNAAVYLHGANAFDRPPATVDAIANEWSSLGVSVEEADFMIDRSVAHYLDRQEENDISAGHEQTAGYEAPDRETDQELGELAGSGQSDREDDMEL